MPIKTTGAEWKAFYNDESVWPRGAFMRGESVFINTTSALPEDYFEGFMHLTDEDEVTLDGGKYLINEGDKHPRSLETIFLRWRKAQSTRRFVVEVHKSVYDELIQIIKANGGRVV